MIASQWAFSESDRGDTSSLAYCSVSAEIDFSIHMHHRTNSITKRGSPLGKSLSSI